MTYEPATGVVEVVAGSRKDRVDLMRLMAKHLLGIDFEERYVPLREYDLSVLLKPYSFPTDPEDGIESVTVRELRLLESANRVDEAVAAARLEERARIRAIVNCEAAEGRGAQALMLATETALSVAEAEKILGASPKESRVEALAQRASAGPEFGASRDERPNPAARADEGWKRAIANANRRFARA